MILITLVLLSGCGLKKMLPEGPAISAEERNRFKLNTASGVEYTAPPKVSFPVIPVMIFGATYDLDIVIVTQNPEWNMHEFAMVETPDGPVWLAKDAPETEALEQTLVADVTEPYGLMPEIPVLRKAFPVRVTDNSTKDRVDVSLAYENFNGESVVASYKGKRPVSLMKKRNGSTMGHSRQLVMAALDVSHRDFGDVARVSYNGKSYGIKRILGLVPFKMVLKQSQGGFAITDIIQRADSTTHRFRNGETTEQVWQISRESDTTRLTQTSDLRTITYHFTETEKALELSSASIRQWGKSECPVEVFFEPSLPDMRRRFQGTVSGRFVIDINGQHGFAVGRTEAYWEGDTPVVKILPENPWWVAERPMETRIKWNPDGSAAIKTDRIE